MTKVKLESRNAILGFKKIAEMIIIAGIGKIYGEKPVGNNTAIEQAIMDIIDESAKYLCSKKSFSKNFKSFGHIDYIKIHRDYAGHKGCGN